LAPCRPAPASTSDGRAHMTAPQDDDGGAVESVALALAQADARAAPAPPNVPPHDLDVVSYRYR
jgi:hypothetical protein